MRSFCRQRRRVRDELRFKVDEAAEFYELEEALDRRDSRINCLLSKKSRFLQGHFTILTARPHVEHFFISNQSMNPFRHFEITGLHPDQIENFVKVFAEDNQEIKDQIMANINASPNIKALATVPQYLQIICFITKESDEVIRMENLTPLYTWMFICLWMKHIVKDWSKLHDYSEIFEDDNVAWFLKHLCHIAYELYIADKIIFTREWISGFIEFDQLQGNEEIQPIFNAFITERKKTGTYQFRHLTLHEFFAAAYCYRKNVSIDDLLREKRFQMVRFIGGFYGADAADENDKERLVVQSFTKCIKSSDLVPKGNKENAEEACHLWFLDLFKELERMNCEEKYRDNKYHILVLQEGYKFANSLSPRIQSGYYSFYLHNQLTEAEIESLAAFLDMLEKKRLLSVLHICRMLVDDVQLTGSSISKILSYIPVMKFVWFLNAAFDSEHLNRMKRKFDKD